MWVTTIQFRSGRSYVTREEADRTLSSVDGIRLVEQSFAHTGEPLDWVRTSPDLCFCYMRGEIVATVHTEAGH